MNRTILLVGLLLVSVNLVSAAPPTTQPRTPQFPLKTKRMIVSDDQIAQAKANIAKYPAAKKVADGVIKDADKWAAMSDDDLRDLLAGPEVPRAFETGTAGCPICGHKLYEKFGQYGWIVDPKNSLKVKCPVCGHVFPDADHPDDGWGWQSPHDDPIGHGEKFWFAAFANHWMWLREVVPGCRALGEAYLLTGDKKYAHKAAVILARVAEVYPGMDYENQSRYGQMMKAQGGHYPGKVVNAIWETNLATDLALAYDDVWDSIDIDVVLQKSLSKSGEQIRASIEANFLEDAIGAVFSGQIRGNFGMHQSTLVHLALVRQNGKNEEWFEHLLSNNTDVPADMGLNQALYNMVYRDGFPSETAPGYNNIWVEKIADYGDLLSRGGHDVFQLPKTRRLFDSVLNQICARSKTPSVGDSGSVYGAISGESADTFQTAWRHYHDPRYANFLSSFGAAGDGGFKSFESLLYPPIEAADNKLPAQPSRLIDGYGMGILNNTADDTAMSMYYGLKAGHGHFDRMTLDLFFKDQAMMPDLGYPDAMNEFVPGIYTWSKNTISHNTVTVDASRQSGNVPGRVELFASGKFARVMDVSALGTYPQCTQYRRALFMIDTGSPSQSYFIDIFTVAGGHQHDYSLHGPPGEFQMIGGKWSDPKPGTLAGENVALNQIYDDPVLGANDYYGGFSSYHGSGFQHLYDVRTQQRGGWVADYTHEKDSKAHVRLRVLDQPGQQIMLCDAHVSPVKYPQVIKYLIARHTGENLISRFISVIEPYGDKPFIDNVEQINIEHGVALKIHLTSGLTDYVLYDPDGIPRKIDSIGLTTDANAVVVHVKDNLPVGMFYAGGTKFTLVDRTPRISKIDGEVTDVDAKASTVRIKMNDIPEEALAKLPSLAGRTAFFTNSLHQTAHPIRSITRDGDELVIILGDDVLVGRAKIDAVTDRSLETQTALPFAPVYAGTTLSDDQFAIHLSVQSVHDGSIELAQPTSFKAGADVWLADIGPGDKMVIPSMGEWMAKSVFGE
jgi:hypothetical protein